MASVAEVLVLVPDWLQAFTLISTAVSGFIASLRGVAALTKTKKDDVKIESAVVKADKFDKAVKAVNNATRFISLNPKLK